MSETSERYAWGRESKVRNSKGEVIHNAESYRDLILEVHLMQFIRSKRIENQHSKP